MATVNYEIEALPSGHAHPEGVKVIKWGPMLTTDVGSPYVAPQFPEKSVQVSGTPGGVDPVVIIQGTNVFTGTPAWGTLTDASDNALSFATADVTANKIETILQNCYQIRPNVTAGDGTTSVTVRLLISTIARR